MLKKNVLFIIFVRILFIIFNIDLIYEFSYDRYKGFNGCIKWCLFIVIIFILYYFYCYMLVEDCFILKYCIV